jgi:glycosyltransferase involved in cell wall biosynthesis
MQRIAAVARRARLEALEPVPYLPLVRPLPGAGQLSAREVAGVRIEPLPMLHVPGVPRLNARALRRAIEPALRRCRDSGRIDILDAQFGYPEGAACVRLACEMGMAGFVTLRGFEVNLLGNDAMRGQLLDAVRDADGCICVSHSLRRVMEEAGADGSRMTVIPNAVDRAVFRPGDRARARSELSLGHSRPVVVSVGRLVSGKRHHLLIEAFSRLRQRHPSALLCIIGGPSFEADYPARLQARVRECGGDEAVRLTGSLPQGEVLRWLQAADVFALATEREGCCNAVLEALATGVPVVTTPAGDNPHFVKDGRNGYLFPVDDTQALEVALGRALARDWDPADISLSLPVGDWDSVAEQVLAYFAERMDSVAHRNRSRA